MSCMCQAMVVKNPSLLTKKTKRMIIQNKFVTSPVDGASADQNQDFKLVTNVYKQMVLVKLINNQKC